MDARLGREHAFACFTSPSKFNEPTLRSREYAMAALAELERLQADQHEIMQKLLKGGNQGAKLLNTDPFQGLREVVQNADDLGATTVRFGTRTVNGRKQLVIVHDGAPVELPHVLPMIYPFFSTKQDSAQLKGRFGIGLKTLGQLGSDLTIHSPPFHFGSRGDHAVAVDEALSIPGFYDPRAEHTLFTIDLEPQYDHQSLKDWFGGWMPSDLVFLDRVHTVTLHDIDQGANPDVLSIQQSQSSEDFYLPVSGVPSKVSRTTFFVEGSAWERFVCQVKVPAGRERAAKATAGFSPISIALPVDGDTQGRIHVALPTKISTHAAFSLDAQFDPSTSREELSATNWNQWLIEASAQVMGALSVYLAQQGSNLAWYVIPVSAQTNSSSGPLNEQFRRQWAKAIEVLLECQTLIEGQFALAQVAYCDETVDGLLTEADHISICGSPMLPGWLRDEKGRWREVMDNLGVSPKLGLASVLEHCGQAGFKQNPPEWFLEVAQRCLDADEENLLLDTTWVPLAEGGRAKPLWSDEADTWLVAQLPECGLTRRHNLCQVVHPLLTSPHYEAILAWLAENANYLSDPTAEHTLRAFSRRYADTPLEAERQDLLDLRDLFEDADPSEKELGREVGAALLIEAFRYEEGSSGRSRTIKQLESPTKLYLPSSIADVHDTWPRAAGITPGLLWASPSYGEMFKISRDVRRRNVIDTKSSGRKRGVKRFLLLLGAETTPRFIPQETKAPNTFLPSQISARHFLGRAQGGLKQDYICPDLDLVVSNLQQSAPAPKSSRKGSPRANVVSASERAIALFRCIDSNWAAIEPISTTYALRSSGKGRSEDIPTTWLARLIDFPWFPNAVGVLCRPYKLVIETKVTHAMYDDHTYFASGLVEVDADSAFARALGMEVNPSVSQLVATLERERDTQEANNDASLMRLFKALAGHCPQNNSIPSPDTWVGDMPVASLRAKFGISRKRRGLIAPCVTTSPARDEWLSPSAVFAGKDIFHARQPFVLADRSLTPLWNALNIGSPDLNACIRELESISAEPYKPEIDAILIDIYRHMDRQLEKTTAADRRSLSLLPLRSAGMWLQKRPMYYCDHLNLASNKITLWAPPCAVDNLPRLIEAAGLERLQFADAPRESAWVTTDEIRFRFKTALKILKADLARDDELSYRAMESWSRFDQLTIYLHPEGSLIVDAYPKGIRPVPVPVRAHADRSAFAVHFDHPQVIGRSEHGGAAIARFAGGNASGSRTREIALAWVSAWASSEDHTLSAEINLASDNEEANLEALIAEQDRLGRSGRKKITKRPYEATSPARDSAPPPQSRHLKALPPDFSFYSTIMDGSDLPQKGQQVKSKKPLVNQPPDRNRQSNTKAPATSYCHYNSAQLQERAWAYVRAAFDRDDFPLEDLQAHRGIGADGAVNWSTFLEMKSFAREAPSEITLTEAEFRRAQECKTKFYLVIVSGLEEGFETEMRIYVNPLNTLSWSPKGSISVSGLTKGAALVLTTQRPEEEGEE
ncbi:hypothetical protein Q022_02235 [Pseudomonas aeruginosa BWHPSA009]|nr:hypothetical protein Q022_02235 [Pseudomonas aeruginosa BWHPSA009]